MNVARFAVTRPVAVVMRIAALVLLGAICLTRLPIDLLPKVTLPTVAVVTQWPNVAPEEIETQITRPIEEGVSSATNLYQVDSTTQEGQSTVRVQFEWGTDIGQAAVDVLQLVQRAERKFPTGDPTLTTPTVFKFDPSQLPILVFGVSGEQDPVKLRTLLDNEVSPVIESANGVASATVTGGESRAIVVDVDPDRLRAYHFSLNDVTRRIAQENLNLPAGIAKQSNTEYVIRSLGWFVDPKEIESIPLGVYDGRVVKMGDVAQIRDAHQETRLYTRLNGKVAVGLTIVKQSDANTVSTAKAVYEKLDKIKKIYPQLTFGLAYDQSQFISESISDVATSALIGGVLAVLVLLFFLRNIRSTMVVALSIPTSIVSTFALIYMCGFTLNTMSLGGLALATGLIVDDAVVVLENIFRHIERDKKTAREAAVSATNEIMSAVVASTWTIMIVFLPLMLIKGQAGQMFTQFALVVIFSIGISLLDATTVVPMLASRIIKGEAHHELSTGGASGNLLDRLFYRFGQWFDALDRRYRSGLRWCIHHRLWVICGAVGMTGACILLVPQIGSEMMPPTDSGDISVTLKLPPGTALSQTDKVVRQAEEMTLANPNVATVFSAAGTTIGLRGASTTLIPFQGSLSVKLKENRKESTTKVISDLRKQYARLPGVRPLVQGLDLVSLVMTGGPDNVEVDIFGDDLSELSRLANQVMAVERDIPGVENLDVNWVEAMPELQWHVDRAKALQMGVTFADIAGTLNTATNGTIASYYQEKGFSYPIVVQMQEATRKQLPDLLNMPVSPSLTATVANPNVPVRSADQGDVYLRQVATPTYGMGPSQITRMNRRRDIAVTGLPVGRSPSLVQADLTKAMAKIDMPTGYYWDWGTNQRRRTEEFAGMGLAVFLAIGLIYMLLASQYELFVHPLTVLLSVPLSAIGVILALFLTGRSFGLTAFVGLLMLVGIVVKNGILLVDYTNVLRGRGMERDEAVLTAGPTRLRPILMTASAAIFGMLPIAIGLGKGSEVQSPMATAVIGGLATSTILTLFVIPTVYTLFDDLSRLVMRGRPTVAPPVTDTDGA